MTGSAAELLWSWRWPARDLPWLNQCHVRGERRWSTVGAHSLPIIVDGVMTDALGCPVAVGVYAGNSGDPMTVAEQIEKLREKLELSQVVIGGRPRHAELAADRQAQTACWNGLDHGREHCICRF